MSTRALIIYYTYPAVLPISSKALVLQIILASSHTAHSKLGYRNIIDFGFMNSYNTVRIILFPHRSRTLSSLHIVNSSNSQQPLYCVQSPTAPIMYTESQSSNKKEEERRGTKVQSNLMGYQNLLSNQPNEKPPAKVNKCNDKRQQTMGVPSTLKLPLFPYKHHILNILPFFFLLRPLKTNPQPILQPLNLAILSQKPESKSYSLDGRGIGAQRQKVRS